jgi:hypothetical protein
VESAKKVTRGQSRQQVVLEVLLVDGPNDVAERCDIGSRRRPRIETRDVGQIAHVIEGKGHRSICYLVIFLLCPESNDTAGWKI